MDRELINNLLRAEIKSCGKLRSVISRETGITESALSRFLYGANCTSGTASILLDYFGFEIKRKKKRKKRKGPPMKTTE